MKERRKGFITGVLVSTILMGLVGTAAATVGSRTLSADYNDIKISVNGSIITPTDANGNTVEPFAINGTTYLPVRAVAEAVNCSVTWDGSNSTVYLYEKHTSNLNYYYQDTGIPRFDNVAGNDAFYDFFIMDNGAISYLYFFPYDRFGTFYDAENVYSTLLSASGYKKTGSGALENGDPYVFYGNNTSSKSVCLMQGTLDNGTVTINIIIENTNSQNSGSSSNSNYYEPVNNSQKNQSSTDAEKNEAYRQAYIDKRMAEKEAREKYGPEIPESVSKKIELDYQNRLNEIDSMY